MPLRYILGLEREHLINSICIHGIGILNSCSIHIPLYLRLRKCQIVMNLRWIEIKLTFQMNKRAGSCITN